MGGLLNVGIGGGQTGVAARMGIGVVPLQFGSWAFAAVYDVGLTGGAKVAGWFDMDLSLQGTWKRPLWGGHLGLTLGAGPALAWARGNSCDSPLCGYVAGSSMAVQGAFEAQAGWWLGQKKSGWEIGFVLGTQCMTNGIFDVTANVALFITDLRQLYGLIVQ